MDVASNFAVSIAPPPYQKEVDEARRDTQARVAIPQLNQSHNSRSQTHIGDRRGNTDGENSLLNAQQHGILDASDEIIVDEDGRRRRKRRRDQGGQDGEHAEDESQQGDNYQFEGNEYAQTEDGRQRFIELEGPVKSGYDPITGYYEIPATRRTKRRSILLRFREQNVHFLDRFSDKNTAVGIINFALCRKYGAIIPHSRLGQVVEKKA